MNNRFSSWLGFLAIAGGIIGCFYVIATGVTSPTEVLLLSIILTTLSIVGSWIASRHYAEYSFNKNQRLFALKAAEKVTNLSNELDRLGVFLSQGLEGDETENPIEVIILRDSRIEAAIHIINTLKSVNDRSLSDWQGVIGEELQAQKEKQEERERGLQKLVQGVEALTRDVTPRVSEEDTKDYSEVRSQIEALRNDIRVITGHVTGISVRRFKKAKPARIEIDGVCPECSNSIHWRQRPRHRSFVAFKCSSCDARLYSCYDKDDFVVKSRAAIEETVPCKSCGTELSLKLDPMPGSSISVTCDECSSDLSVHRTNDGVSSKLVQVTRSKAAPLTEDVIEAVRQALPPQPWEKGVHKKVAESLEIPSSSVSRAITELIRRNIVKPQIDGKVYTLEEESP